MVSSDMLIIRHPPLNTKNHLHFRACFGDFCELMTSNQIDRAYQAVLYLHNVKKRPSKTIRI